MKLSCPSLVFLFATVLSGTVAKPTVKDNGREHLRVVDENPGKKLGLDGSPGAGGVGHILVFMLSPGRIVRLFTSPRTEELSIHLEGVPGALTAEEKAYLSEIKDILESDANVDTDTIDSLGGQGFRAARLLIDWPDTLEIDYELDLEAENARAQERLDALEKSPMPQDHPEIPSGRRALHRESSFVYDEKKHPNRRLAYTSLCSSMYQYVAVTHDDWSYDRWDDKTTYYAYISNHGGCGSSNDGTWFWTGSQWECMEPDHDPNIEWAYGDCFGRCGAGCGSSSQYTQDCADHDSCVRFGHSLASFWCDDEFSYTIDDALWAPNCL